MLERMVDRAARARALLLGPLEFLYLAQGRTPIRAFIGGIDNLLDGDAVACACPSSRRSARGLICCVLFLRASRTTVGFLFRR